MTDYESIKNFHERMKNQAKKDYTPEEAKLIKDRLSLINEKFLEGELISPDNIYIDLSLLFDINIGTLFSIISRRDDPQKDYEHIKNNLKEYQVRVFDDPLRYFPELNITQEEFKAHQSNPRYHSEIFVFSPATMFHYVLRDNLKTNAKHSQMKHKYTKHKLPDSKNLYIKDYDDVTFFVNTYPLKLSEHYRKNLQALLSDNFGVCVALIEEPLWNIPEAVLRRMDEFNIYRLDHLLRNTGIQETMGKETYIGKYLFTPFLVDPSSEESLKADDAFRKAKLRVTGHMSLCCFFQWLEAGKYSIDLSCYEREGEDDAAVAEEEMPIL